MTHARALDLVILVADKDMEQSILGLLSRPRALGIRPLKSQILIHPEHDPGCFLRSPDFLRPFLQRSDYALVLFDCEGSGRESQGRLALEENLENRLGQTGWLQRAAAICIAPELENWFWSQSPQVDLALGWQGRRPRLRTWLQDRDLLASNEVKPQRPKEALEQALKEVRKPRSSAVYRQLAGKVSLSRCEDLSFAKLRQKLAEWFPATF